MAYNYHFNNPGAKIVDDSSIRAISAAIGEEWDRTYIALAIQGFLMHDIQTSNAVINAYLIQSGFTRYVIENMSEFYTVQDFVQDNPVGTYILSDGVYFVTVKDGSYFDSIDSGYKIPQYYWRKD